VDPKLNAANDVNNADLSQLIEAAGEHGVNGPLKGPNLLLRKDKNRKKKTLIEHFGPNDVDIDTDPLGFKWTDIFVKSDMLKESEMLHKFTKENSKLLNKYILVDGTYIYETEK